MQPNESQGTEATNPQVISPELETPASSGSQGTVSEPGVPASAPSPEPQQPLAVEPAKPGTPAVTTQGASQKFAKPLALVLIGVALLLLAAVVFVLLIAD